MKVEFTIRALVEVERIRAHMAAQNPAAADRVVDRIRSIARRLEVHPFSGRPTRRPEFRVILVSPFPYLVSYTVMNDTVTILRVRHTSRRPLASTR
jgi:toxin ParE1/3/4